MTNIKENKENWMKKTKAGREAITSILLVLCLFGLALAGWGFLAFVTYEGMKNTDNLTDKDIPMSQIENATWTYSRSEINAIEGAYSVMAAIGVLFAVISFLGIVALPSKKERHYLTCPENIETKYCPECGLKMSMLDEKHKS